MGDNALSAIVHDAHSNYGSEIDTRSVLALSDYGSDLEVEDIDETTLVGNLLQHIAARAPKTVVPPRTEVPGSLAGEDEAVVVRTPERPALRCAYSSPAWRKKASVEVEYGVQSRRAFSGRVCPA
jgi:exonuclease V